MSDWIAEHPHLTDLALGVITVALWIFYAQLLISGYRRQRRPRILINQGVGINLDSRCLISNMSQKDSPVAACRSFELLETQGTVRLKPRQIDTRQMISARNRKAVQAWIKDSL